MGALDCNKPYSCTHSQAADLGLSLCETAVDVLFTRHIIFKRMCTRQWKPRGQCKEKRMFSRWDPVEHSTRFTLHPYIMKMLPSAYCFVVLWVKVDGKLRLQRCNGIVACCAYLRCANNFKKWIKKSRLSQTRIHWVPWGKALLPPPPYICCKESRPYREEGTLWSPCR